MSAAASVGPAESPLVPGYVLETLLGRGGSGEVWRAVPRRGGPPVAIKLLVDGDPERQAREAALLGELDHPHLVRLIEVVHQPRRGGVARVALVLELLEGGSLAALLARRGRLRPGEVVTAIAPVAAALAHAHGIGVVHGDLAPGNIVFTAEGRPVLTDLGVARVLGEVAAGEVTPPYVDPTVARGGAPGPASDVFGVAAAAFHALTGIAPWNAATPADTLAVAAAGYLPDLTELAPAAPPELIAVIERGLSADPHDRGSAAAFALDLRHACRPEPVRLPVSGVPDAELGRTGRGPRTELTHQVPGRHPRPAPAVVAAAGTLRWAALRERAAAMDGPLGRRTAVLAVVAAGLIVAGLTAALWKPAADDRVTPAVAAATSPVASAPAAPEAAPRERTPPAEESSPADRHDPPTSAQGWAEVVADLYGRRAAAFAAGSAQVLTDVYAPGSALCDADVEHVGDLAQARELLRGFTPSVVRVDSVVVTGDRVEVVLVDRWAEYDVVAAGAPDGPALRTEPGRAESIVRMALVLTPDGWRIDGAHLVA
jgi:hypothetical protein